GVTERGLLPVARGDTGGGARAAHGESLELGVVGPLGAGAHESAPPQHRAIVLALVDDHLDHRSSTDEVAARGGCPFDLTTRDPLDERGGDLIAEVEPVRRLPAPPEQADRRAHRRPRRSAWARDRVAGPTTGSSLTMPPARLAPTVPMGSAAARRNRARRVSRSGPEAGLTGAAGAGVTSTPPDSVLSRPKPAARADQ